MYEAAIWYEERNPAAAEAFLTEIQHAFEAIVDGPLQWPRFKHSTRRFVLRDFPFGVIFRFDADSRGVRVIAVAHTSRRPGYWRTRV